MKKSITLGLFLVMLFLLVGCDQWNVTNTTTSDYNVVDSESTATSLALPAASLASLIGPFLNSTTSEALSFTTLGNTEETDPVLNDVSELDKYLELIGQFLEEDNGLTVTLLESDREDYTYMTTYAITTLYDGIQTFTLYYNETIPVVDTTEDEPTTTDTQETTTLSFNQKDDSFPVIDDESEEVTAYIDALLIDGENEILLDGAFVDNGTEQVLRLYAYTDHQNYVKLVVKTDTTDNVKKFNYVIVSEGITVSESKIFVETEDGNLHVKLELLSGTVYTKFNAVVEVEDSITKIKIRYEISDSDVVLESGHIKITATIDDLTGETIYDYQVLPDGFAHGYGYTYHHQNHTKNEQDSETA
ncbi:MAG: hypothetical protein AB7U79_00070 [Candidatus Izemoplasmatales bacterium]